MYKSFADNPNSGGIWNNAVYISYAKQDLTPKLTMKVILKHNSRNKLSIKAGVSTNLSATEPDATRTCPFLITRAVTNTCRVEQLKLTKQ